ncbi:hypothetical protein QAD02_006160 [Eretmocerus hayati]|uniref:Uncharacterized protein n=1 Tax=Eretmocerus hayati TaxID=131215 RepID=A0ACC2N0K9_9HYME|nr:hypothetical protein QAD02_006160 [Eretmocerus hayati]
MIMGFYKFILIAICSYHLNTCTTTAGKSDLLYEWKMYHPKAFDVDNTFFIEHRGSLLRIVIYQKPGPSKEHFFFIDSIEFKNDTSLCTTSIIPKQIETDSISRWKLASLRNGKLVASSSSTKEIFIIDVKACHHNVIEYQSGLIIPDYDSFDVVRKDDSFRTNGYYISRFDHQGELLDKFEGFPTNSSDSVINDYEVLRTDGIHKKYLSVGYIKNGDESKNTILSIVDSSYHVKKSRKLSIYVDSHSSAHNNLTLFYCDEGLGYLALDANLNTKVKSNNLAECESVQYSAMHNLHGGGAIIVYCQEILDSDECEMNLAIVDEHGKLRSKPITLEEAYSFTNILENDEDVPHPYYQPIIIEKSAEYGIYCIVLPADNFVEEKCIKI